MGKSIAWALAIWLFGLTVGVVVGRFVIAPAALVSDDHADATSFSSSSALSGGGDASAHVDGVPSVGSNVTAEALIQSVPHALPPSTDTEISGRYFNDRLAFRFTRSADASAGSAGASLLMSDPTTGGPVLAVRDGRSMVWDLSDEAVVLLSGARPSLFLGSRAGQVDLELGYKPLASPRATGQAASAAIGDNDAAAEPVRFDARAVLELINGPVETATYRDGTRVLKGVARLADGQAVTVLATFSPNGDYPLTSLRVFRENRQTVALERIRIGDSADVSPGFELPAPEAASRNFKVFQLSLEGITPTQSAAVTRRGLLTTLILAGLRGQATDDGSRARADQLAGFRLDWEVLAERQARRAEALKLLMGID